VSSPYIDDHSRVESWDRTAHTLNKTITDTYVPLLSDTKFEGEVVPPPAKIPWCVPFPIHFRLFLPP